MSSALQMIAMALSSRRPVFDVAPGTYTNTPGLGGSYSLESDGDIVGSLVGDAGDWVSPKSYAPGAYEARATLNSGSLASGTTGSWLALSTTRTWTTSALGTANLTIEIRDGAGTVKATGTVEIAGGGSI